MNLKKKIEKQIKITKKHLKPDGEVRVALIEFTKLVEVFMQYLEEMAKKP